MKVKELIEKFEERKTIIGNFQGYAVWWEDVKEIFEQLDEPETGHADEAPRYLKNILARLRELPVHNREVWLKVIMSEFKQDFSHAKWREGYEQGKLEGMVEREKVKVKQFVADWYEENKDSFEFNVWDWIAFRNEPKKLENKEFNYWINDGDGNPIQTLVNMHQFGYEVEEEKKYKITLLNRNDGSLYLVNQNAGVSDKYGHFSPVVLLFTKSTNFSEKCYKLTKKDVVANGFGWVFSCEGIEIEEVE